MPVSRTRKRLGWTRRSAGAGAQRPPGGSTSGVITGRAGRAGRGAAFLGLLLLAAACGYRLSGRNQFLPPEIRRIAVPVFANETRRADIEQRLTESILRELIKRGDLLSQPQREGADAVLEGTVTGYSAVPVALDAQGGATRLEVVIQARVTLKESRTERVLWSQDHFIFRSQYEVDRTARESFDREIVAIDRIARDFAETIVTSLLEGF